MRREMRPTKTFPLNSSATPSEQRQQNEIKSLGKFLFLMRFENGSFTFRRRGYTLHKRTLTPILSLFLLIRNYCFTLRVSASCAKCFFDERDAFVFDFIWFSIAVGCMAFVKLVQEAFFCRSSGCCWKFCNPPIIGDFLIV